MPDRTERIAPDRMEFFDSSAPSPHRWLSLGVALGTTTIGVVFGLVMKAWGRFCCGFFATFTAADFEEV